MKVVIPGGSGQIGAVLARAFQADGHQVIVLSRKPLPAPWPVVQWDGASLGKWTETLDGTDVVINLAGRSVDCRYGAKNRREIKESRVQSTRIIDEAIARAAHPPPVWLQAGTATIYAHRHDADNNEVTGILGGSEPGAPDTWRFSSDVARAWEDAVLQAHVPNTRKIIMRSAMTMSPDAGGVFSVLLRLVRWGLGGAAGDGRQYVSWIHENDFVQAVYWLINHRELEGPVNLTSPHPMPNSEFMRTLREAWDIGWGLPAKKWMVEAGAFFLRTESELILKSRRVVPGRLQQSGFEFRFPRWREAAAELCGRWREGQLKRREAHSVSTISPQKAPVARP